MNTRHFGMCYLIVLLIVGVSKQSHAHLGEEHPSGEHDYFPDFPVSALNGRVGLSPLLPIVAALDVDEIPDGSGRFFGMRGFNRVVIASPDSTQATTYLQTGPRDDTAGTEGSTAMALHPEFSSTGKAGSGKFYTISVEKDTTASPDFASGCVTESTPPCNLSSDDVPYHSILREWTADDPNLSTFRGSSREVLRFALGTKFHNVNDLKFGADGYLYIAVGEDTYREQALSLESAFGKILRIDPMGTNSASGQYGIPPDNPFIGDDQAVPEIYAYGFRNPWRIAFDSLSGDLYAMEVGLLSIEEVDKIVPAGNYGWPIKEGSFLTAREAVPDIPDPDTGLTIAQQRGFIDPLFELDHTDTASVIGGVVYRGSRFQALQGKVIFGSWDTGDIYVGDPSNGEIELLLESDAVQAMMEDQQRYLSINEGLNGEIYLAGGLAVMELVLQLSGDLNGDQNVDKADIDFLVSEIAGGSMDSALDLNGDSQVNTGDIGEWLVIGGEANGFAEPYLFGDSDLSGKVDAQDLDNMALNWQQSHSTWRGGDFDGSGIVDTGDLNLLAVNWDQQISVAAPVPEPSPPVLILFGFAAFWFFFHRASKSS